MIKQLKIKFVLINMLLISMVLLLLFGVLYVTTYQRVTRASQMMLHRTLTESDPFTIPRNPLGAVRGSQFLSVPTFLVRLDESESIVELSGVHFDLTDRAAVEDVVKEALNQGQETGVLESAQLRYLIYAVEGLTSITFVDRTHEVNTLSSLTQTALLVGVGSLSAYLLISLFLAQWALRPVEHAWRQQQQFISDASHELKTPLTVILANIGIVVSKPELTIREREKWLGYIQTEAERLKSMVDSLLFLARAEHPQQIKVFSHINLTDVVWETVLPFESVVFEQKKSLDTRIEPNLFIQGDDVQLRQLVYILLDNACKYGEVGGVVRVQLKKLSEKEILLCVANTGSWIPPDDLGRIFDRFYRVDKSRARDQGGYGLGLSIAKSIVDLHHGRIHAHSSHDEGTWFNVVFNADV